VPLVDVLRAAVAEVEDYTRIKVISATKAALAGSAVADVIHMLAELAENATVFSPPNTPVLITGDLVGKGFAVEIEDRGLGLSEEKLAQINDRLANPPPFDPSGTDQLGLFVASQLAKRHDIRVSMRTSPYGGTTAIVLIPHSLVIPEGAGAVSLPAGPENLPLRPGRHAGPEALQAPGNGHETAGWTAGRTLGARSLGTEPYLPQPPALDTWSAPTAGTQPREEDEAWAAGGMEPAAGADPGGYDSDDTGPIGLPRRIRQASLAPQLRTSAPRVTPPPGADVLAGQMRLGERPGEERREGPTPDETRATLSAIQQGWQRGRSVFDASVTGEAPLGDRPGPAATPGLASATPGLAGATPGPAGSPPAGFGGPTGNGSPDPADGHAGPNGHAERPGDHGDGGDGATLAVSGAEVGTAGPADGPAHESEPGSETGGTRGWS
jgi:hypothetical protein